MSSGSGSPVRGRIVSEGVVDLEEEKASCGPDDAELRFRHRYAVLKEIYEGRLQSIASRVQDAQAALETDPVLLKMRSSETTAVFAPERAEEIVAEALEDEREGQLIALAEQLAEAKSQVAAQAIGLDRERYTQQSLRKQVAQATHQRDEVTRRLEEVVVRLREGDQRWKGAQEEHLFEKRKLSKAVRRLETVVIKSLRSVTKEEGDLEVELSAGSDSDGSDGFLSERESHSEWSHRERPASTLGHRSSSNSNKYLKRIAKVEEKLRLSLAHLTRAKAMELESTKLKLGENERRVAELTALHLEEKEELQKTRQALKRCEEERLELREQYMTIGHKLERLVSAGDEQGRQITLEMQSKVEESEARCRNYVSLSERLQGELHTAALQAERREAHVSELKQKIEQLERELKDQATNFANRQRIQVEAEQTKTKYAEDKLEQATRTYEAKLEKAQKETASAAHAANVDRAKWEQERDRQLKEFQLKVENQFQKLLDAKQKELDLAVRQRDLDIGWRKEASERLDSKVAEKLQKLLQDHISIAQHKEIVQQQVKASQDQAARLVSEATRQSTIDQKRAVEEIEAKTRASFENRLVAADKERQATHAQLEHAQSEVKDLENTLREERRRFVTLQAQTDDITMKNQALASNLDQALQSIDKLKRLLQSKEKRHDEDVTAARLSGSVKLESLEAHINLLEQQLAAREKALDEAQKAKLLIENEYEKKLRVFSEGHKDSKQEVEQQRIALATEQSRTRQEISLQWETKYTQMETKLKHELEMLSLKTNSSLREAEAKISDLEEKLKSQSTTAELAAQASEQQSLATKTRESQLVSKVKAQASQIESLQQENAKANEELKHSQKQGESFRRAWKHVSLRRTALAKEFHTLHNTHRTLSQDVKRQMEASKRDFTATIDHVRDVIRAQAQQVSHKALSQTKELDGIHQRRVEALQTEIRYLQAKVDETQAHRESIQVDKDAVRTELAKALEERKKLELDLAHTKDNLTESLARFEKVAQELHEGTEREAKCQVEIDKYRQSRIAVEKQLELRENHLLSLLATIRENVSISQEAIDDVVDIQRCASYGIPKVQLAFEETLKRREKDVAAYTSAPLQAKIEQLEALRPELERISKELLRAEESRHSFQEQLGRTEERLHHSNEKYEELTRAYNDVQNQLEQTKSRIDTNTEQAQEERRALQAEFERTLDNLKKSHKESKATIIRDFQASEQAAREKLDREKARNRRLREELMASATSASVGDNVSVGSFGASFSNGGVVGALGSSRTLRFGSAASSSATISSVPTSPIQSRASNFESDNNIQRLLRRSAALDSAADEALATESPRKNGNRTDTSVAAAASFIEASSQRMSARRELSSSLPSSLHQPAASGGHISSALSTSVDDVSRPGAAPQSNTSRPMQVSIDTTKSGGLRSVHIATPKVVQLPGANGGPQSNQ